MRVVKSRTLLRDIKQAQPGWFSRGNKRFFHDVSYEGYYGKATGNPYLVRTTYAWTDMFGQEPRLHYRINSVNPDTLHIEPLIVQTFNTIHEVKDWLKIN